MIPEKLKKNNSNYPSTLRHTLGYLPTILLKLIIDDKILDKKETENDIKFPKIFSFQTTCLFIDISHFFDNNYENKANQVNNIDNPDNNNNNNNDENKNKENSKKKLKQNDLDELISPEFFYFCINRYYERLISIITNHGGDVIFQGNGIYAIWPPDKKEVDSSISNISNSEANINESIPNDKKVFLSLKAIQCALEIKRNSIMEIKQGCSFVSKIGCSLGECKFIIFQSINNKLNYIVLGDALTNSCESSKKDKKGGQIIIGNKIISLVNEFFNLKEFYVDGIKFCYVIDSKNKETQIKSNKATTNLIKNNFSLEQIALNNHKIMKFIHDVIFNLFQRNYFDEKWLKEIKNVTLIFLRLKMNQKDLEDPNKLQDIFNLVLEIVINNGGNIHKLQYDNKGILIIITFGISSSSSGFNEIKGALSSMELSAKLKQINVYPFIGVTSGDLFCGLCGTVGNRREYSVLGSAYINGLTMVENAEIMYGDKKSGNDNILIDEKTMVMIDAKIPCKFWKKIISTLGFEINLFIPLKISNILHLHSESNLFPLIGCHLSSSDSVEYVQDEDFQKEDYIIYFEENILKDYVQTLNDYIEKKSKIKIINVCGPTGCGKTMLLQKSLKTFFQMNPKLREILCNSNYGDDYPFIFSANLNFCIGNNILLENNIKEYRGLHLIIKDIFNILYNDDYFKKDVISLFIKNDCAKYIKIFQDIYQIYDLINNIEDIEDVIQDNEIKKDMMPNINAFIYDLLNKYKEFLLTIYEEKLSKYNLEIPLIFLFEDFNICDENTKDFIRFYLKQEQNPFLIITAYSFQLFPYFNFLSKREKDLFYEYNDESIVKKYKLTPYDTEEKITKFCESILYELRKAKLNSVSPSLIKFLLNKTFNGIPQFIKELILTLYDNNLVYITKNQNKELVEDERFKKMLYFNDFTELNIPDIIQKKVGAIIDNFLDKLEIYILKIASIIGDVFDLTILKQAVRIDNNTNASLNILKESGDRFLYEKLCSLEENNIIEILYDLDIKKKYVICKFSIPFLREVLYQRTPSEYRNQMHYVIGKLVKSSTMNKSHHKLKYMDKIMELGILEKHLKYSQVSIHDNFLNGKLSTTQLKYDNYLNINNLKTLIIRQICAKIKSIRINDDKNNMIKAGYIYKKSDGKLTWEYRYFVLTTNRVLYFYTENDYLERNKAPLAVFYLQNLFNIKLLTDGSVGGKNNIISLIVNEWFKRGEVMKPRVYYLSVEDREESYKWVITLNILKIKAFYEKYCFGFGYVNFPLYGANKNEFILKAMKLKFKLPAKKVSPPGFRGRQNKKRQSIYNPYLSLGRVENRLNTIAYENYVIKQILIYIKFVIVHSLCVFFGNIQLGLSKKSNEYEDSKIYAKFRNEEAFDFLNPSFYIKIMDKEERDEKKIKRYLDVITLKYKEDKKNNNIYASNKNDYTEKQLNYFNKYYKNSFINQEKINFVKKKSIKNIRDVQNMKIVTRGKLKELDADYLVFKNSEEVQIDKEDYLDYIDYTDNDGRLKDQYKRMDSSSISKNSNNSNTKPNPRKTKIDFFTKRESMFDTDVNTNNLNNNSISDIQNNEKNCPILNLLNKQNIERKKKLMNSEIEKEKRDSKFGSSGLSSNNSYDSSEEAKKIANESKDKELFLSDNISNSNDKDDDKDKKNEQIKENKKKKTNSVTNNKNKNKNNKRKSPIKNHNSKNNNKNKSNAKDKENNKNKNEIKINNESFDSIQSKKNIFAKFSLGGNSNNNEEIKFISEIKNITIEHKNTNKSEFTEDKNESGKFGGSENNFKELLKKLIEDKQATQKPTNILRRSKKKKKEIINTLSIAEKKNENKEQEKNYHIDNENESNTQSLNNNSGCLIFTLNGENEKSEKNEENNLSKEKNRLFEINERKEKEDNKEKEKEKKVENEENKINSSSSKKKEQTDGLHNSNLNKEISLNTISSIDNYIESMKNITGSNYHSINKLISDIGSRGGRRKSNITNSYFKNKGIFNINEISYSSSQSNNLFNNNLDIYHRRNSHLILSRCNSTQNINMYKNNLNNFIFLNNIKSIKVEKAANNEKSNNGSSPQNSGGQDSLSLINKLKNLNVSLENERSYSNILYNLNKAKKKIKENNKNNMNFNFSKTPNKSRNHSRNIRNKQKFNAKVRTLDINTESTKSTASNFYYPNVYYINNDNNLHRKTHVSTLFEKLKSIHKK